MSTIPGLSEEDEIRQVMAETPDFVSFFKAVAWAFLNDASRTPEPDMLDPS